MVAGGTELCQIPWIELIDGVHHRRQMNSSIANIGHGEKEILRQFALNAEIPLLNVRIGAWIAREKVETERIAERWTKGGRRWTCESITIPRSAVRNVCAATEDIEETVEKLAVLVGNLIVAVLVRSAIQMVDRITGEYNHLVVQLVSDAKARTKVPPVDVRAIETRTARASAEQGSRARERRKIAVTIFDRTDCSGIGDTRAEENDCVRRLAFDSRRGEGLQDVPAQADINRQPRSDLDVVLNVRANIKVAELRFR